MNSGRPGQIFSCVLVFLAMFGCSQKESGPSVQDLMRREKLREREKLSQPKTLPQRLANVEDLLANRNFAAARKASQRLLISHPSNHLVISLAAKCEAESGNPLVAVEILAAIDNTDLPAHTDALWLASQWLVDAAEFDAAQQQLERILQFGGQNSRVHRKLALILNNQGRRIEAAAHLRALARSGDIREKELFAMNTYSNPFIDDSLPKPKFRGSLIPAQLAQAKIFRSDGELERSRDLLRGLADAFPESTPISAFQGRVLADLQDEQGLRKWVGTTPEGIEQEPEYWHTLGVWLRRQNRHRQAVRCLAEAVSRDETDRYSYLALANSLKLLGEDDAAQQAAQRFEWLTEASAIAKKLGLRPGTLEELSRMADLLLQLRRPWEAISWREIALKRHRASDSVRAKLQQRRESLAAEKSEPAPIDFRTCGLDLSQWPLPTAEVIGSLVSMQPQPNPGQALGDQRGDIFFEDQAEKRGWVHTCEIAPEAINDGLWIYQTVGGGVGVIDFDLDGWPDLVAAMLNGQPLHSDSSPNRLFRNIDGQFVDCTTEANYLDHGFSQGIAVGDFNDDGFPDLFDANIGHNRLFRNNGDGSFSEVSVRAGMDGEFWTTSAVIADIDGDGIADIYETAYCRGPDPYQRRCKNGRSTSTCLPLDFQPEKDRLWRGVGDGRFVDVSQQWMSQTTPGRGLGVLAGRFDERPGLDLYIANDMSVNHLWAAATDLSGASDPSEFRLTDVGAIRGLGFSGRSLMQASMGMAAGDPDGDGDIDFFLTHFAGDHNTFYEQVEPGLWIDRSFQVGLAMPSMKLLGFGTEWADFDNNGSLELIVANGHVNQFSTTGVAYRMPAQVLGLDDGGGWSELDRKNLGAYFSSKHLGRALVTLDADRDGRTDVAITHLRDPVALLMNRTTGAGRSIRLQLKSTQGQRDAIGAMVTATIGGRQLHAQLIAGDGYMCSNQRQIALGTGSAGQAEKLTVVWSSGERENFGNLASGQEYLLVEGSGEAYPLPGNE